MSLQEKIAEILETHFCDLEETEEYENTLRKNAVEYFEGLSLGNLAEYYKALGDDKRLGILLLLGFREMCVCELTAALGISQPNLSHHIRKLENAGLVRSERRGKWVYYSLVDDSVLSRLFIQ
jgi:ArsR family transcriptional regulator